MHGSNENPEYGQYPEITKEILERVKVDQDMREKDLNDSEDTWDENIDLQNTEAMKRVITEIGWPTVSKVGETASRAAWLLVQHADHDPIFQQQCLDLMREQPDGEVNKIDAAYLEDRVWVKIKQKQRYGTQMQETRDAETNMNVVAYEPVPIEDEEHVNERRAALGMMPLEEYVKDITSRYYPHLLKTEK